MTTAKEIVQKIYQERDNVDYEVLEKIDRGGEYVEEAPVIVRAGSECMVIAGSYDRHTDVFVGYTWTTYATPDPVHGEDCFTDGSCLPSDARIAIIEFVEQAQPEDGGYGLPWPMENPFIDRLEEHPAYERW